MHSVTHARSQDSGQTLAQIQADSFEMVKHALEPVLQSLQPRAVKMPKPHNDTSPLQVPVPRIVPATAAATVRLESRCSPRSSPQSIEAIPSLQYPASSPSWREAGDLGYSPVWSAQEKFTYYTHS
ncbi:hypothetical protein EDB83DRAFT_2319059 [Lactarius deliciosus]|nr:hypothetical protein EDB83DRAFT_2319059 [Lactarius deliciosus]